MARDIDVAGATAALDAAGIDPTNVEAQREDPFASRPAAQAPAEVPAAPEVPAAGEVTPEAPEVEKTPEEMLEEFTNIPDEALTEAQIQMKRSLQADYTVKTQQAAPWRKLADELGVENPEDLKAVIDTARQLQDPNNWEQLHTELTAHLMSTGRLTQAQAETKAADQMAAFAPADEVEDDPDVDPALLALQRQVAELTNTVKQEQTTREQFVAQQKQQQEYDALAQALTNSENEIKKANPHYTDAEVGAIYKFLGPDMDLHKARNEYESVIGAQVARYINSKGGTAHEVPTPVPGAGVPTAPATESKMSREEGHQRALAWAAAADAAE